MWFLQTVCDIRDYRGAGDAAEQIILMWLIVSFALSELRLFTS